jgi:ABC-2 type transport system ATP-binding protein
VSGAAVDLRGVRRSFGGKQVLRGVTARAEYGKVIGLLGRNGEGKTTLFKIMLDLLAADSGSVEVLGEKLNGLGAIRGKVGWVPEKPSFHAFMRVGQVLELRRRFFPAWDDARARRSLRRLELDLDARIEGASKGTLAKLAWVCATAHAPKLLLLDEPTSGLDALVREELLNGLIAELHDAGRTIMVSNHRMEELAGVLDEVWVLSEGRIAATHDVNALRAGAKLLRGRLKGGRLAERAVLTPAAAEAAAAEFETLETAPLPVKDALRELLRGEGSDDR